MYYLLFQGGDILRDMLVRSWDMLLFQVGDILVRVQVYTS